MGRLTNKAQIGVFVREITTAGTPEHLGGYIKAITISFTASNNTISDSGSNFLAKNFQAGDKITLSGSTNNNGDYEISSVVAGVIVITDIGVLIDEVAGDTVTITETQRTGNRQEVDNGISLVVRAHPDNAGVLYVAGSESDIANSTKRATLQPSQALSFQVQNYRALWCDVATSGDDVEISQEK